MFFHLAGHRDLNNKTLGTINKLDDLMFLVISVSKTFVKVLKLRKNVCLLSVFFGGWGECTNHANFQAR